MRIEYDMFAWKKWFAWHPINVKYSHTTKATSVWWEYVWRRVEMNWAGGYEYRLYEEGQ